MANIECVCGFIGSHGHLGGASGCKVYRDEVARLCETMKDYIADYYKTVYSVTDCCRYIVDKENSKVLESSLRMPVTLYLDSLGIRERLGSKILNAKRQEKTKATMIERYGVENAGQMEGNGFTGLNKIPYTKLKFNTEFNEYKKDVEKATWRKVCQLQRFNNMPTKCYYTGITFNDNVLEKVNPNDPYKRTLDHKTSVSEAFFRGWTVDQVVDDSNIVFCLRIVNTVKGHLNESDFRRLLLPLLKKRLEDESQIS